MIATAIVVIILYIQFGLLSAAVFEFGGLIDIALWPLTDALILWNMFKEGWK